VTELCVENGRATGVLTSRGAVSGDAVLLTAALPVVAGLMAPYTKPAYTASLRSIDYLANVCLVLELDRSLSDTYRLVVNDPAFPYVGVVEHTNFEPAEHYGGRHILYLPRYLAPDDPGYDMGPYEVLALAAPHLQRMFPAFRREWVLNSHVWKARYARPVVTCGYGDHIPDRETPVAGVYLATRAQIHPEDRGTNYAVREGRAAAQTLLERLTAPR
jgi:protoporphyrinogen oxidase